MKKSRSFCIKRFLALTLSALLILCSFAGCSSYEAENANLPETEFVFPETTWGMSVNDVKQSYKDLHEVSDAKTSVDSVVQYVDDELEFCGLKMSAEFSFYERDGKTWLYRAELTSIDPMTDKELLEYINREDVIAINETDMEGTTLAVSEEKYALFDKNREYLGFPTDGIQIPWNLYEIGGGQKIRSDGKHYVFFYEASGFLLTSYDLQTGESLL